MVSWYHIFHVRLIGTIALELFDNMSRACNKRNVWSRSQERNEWESFFLVIFVKSDVVLSNDKKEKREKEREIEAARFKGWQVTKSGV